MESASESTMTLTGGCLCGKVRYEVTGQARRFYLCYCQRCRKVTGSAHASHLFARGDLNWLAGAEEVSSYELPEAQHFANSFCRGCGSRVPRVIPAFKAIMIPAGSLDQEPPLAPEARIFEESRARWCESVHSVAGHAGYPPA